MPAQFLTDLDMRDLKDGRNVVLLAPLDYQTGISRFGRAIFRAPKGFITDFASVPRMFWRMFPPFGQWNCAAVIHDAAYRGELRGQNDCRVRLSRAMADDLFYEALTSLGVAPFTRRLMYWAVRVGGRHAYKAGLAYTLFPTTR